MSATKEMIFANLRHSSKELTNVASPVNAKKRNISKKELDLKFQSLLRQNGAVVMDINKYNITNSLREVFEFNSITSLIFENDIFITENIKRASQESHVIALPSNLHHRQLEAVKASITLAKMGIAETGTLVFLPNINQFRGLYLVPKGLGIKKIHLVVIKKDDIIYSFSQAMKTDYLSKRSNILFISGNSMITGLTVDSIEGAHGPQKLIILLWEEVIDPLKERKDFEWVTA